MSQEELAHRIRVDRTYESDIERGQRNFGVQLLFACAKALRVDPEELLG
jgi:transcriptional regulator with XRE-family HTH domain